MAANIKLLSGGGFVDQSVSAETVGDLRNELNIAAGAVISVNGQNVRDNQALNDGDMVAAVHNDKTGGICRR